MEDLFQFGMSLFNEGYKMENEDTKVSVTLGYTLNLGNFQSLRLDLGIVDSRRNGETPDQAFERVYKFVEDKLTAKILEAQSEAAEG
jgi:hypothetical protein